MSKQTRLSRFLVYACALLLGAGLAGQAHAQAQPQPAEPPGQPGEAPMHDDELLELELELVQMQQRLEEIQRAALEANPELEQRAESLGELMVEVMEEEGFDPQTSIDRIHEIQATMQDPELDPEQRMQLMEEAQAEYMQLEQAQAAAMQDQRVQDAHESFQEDIVQAMQEEDPATEEIIDEFTRKHERYEERRAEAALPDEALR